MKVPVVKQILKANDSVAVENARVFQEAGIVLLNVMASPGAGKTSLILATAERLPDRIRPAVIEGDLASSIDADRIAERGIPVVQINTGGNCHLDAPMVRSTLEHFDLDAVDLLFVENVGNLICPSNYRLGNDTNVVVASVPEGFDKPHKYPGIFARADIILVNKWDMAEIFEFDLDFFTRGVRMVNPEAPVITVSARTGHGMADWMAWVQDTVPVPAA